MPSKKVASAYVDLQLQTAAFKAAIGEASSEMHKFGSQMREESQKSRESVRLLSEELGLGIPRGLQGVISKLPGVSTALNAAFDGVVILTLIKLTVEAGEKIYEFAKKSEESARKAAKANEEFSSGLEKRNLELQVSNDKIADNIARLEHKPTNGLKDALDEARLSAFYLAKQLDEAINKERELLDASGANWIQRFLGASGNDSLKTGLSGYQSQQQGVNDRYKEELQPNSWSVADAILGRKMTPDEAAKARDEELTRNTEAYYNRLRTEFDERRELQTLQTNGGGMTDDRWRLEQKYGAGDQSKIMMPLQNLMQNIGTIGHGQEEQSQADALAPKEKALTSSKDADAARLKTFEDAYEREKTLYGMSVTSEIAYWTSKLSAFSKGSSEYHTIQDKLYKDYGERSKIFTSIRADAKPTVAPESVLKTKLVTDSDDDVLHQGERWEKFNVEVAKGYEQYDKFTAKANELQNKFAEATGAITPHEAALKQAAVAAEEYRTTVAALRAELGKVNKDASLTPEQRATASIGIQNQIDQLGYDNQLRQINDRNSAYLTSFGGQMSTMLTDWANKATDLSSIMSTLFVDTLNEVNDAIIKLLTTKNDPHPFRAAGHAIFTDVAQAGLKGAEGEILKALGLSKHKPAGSKGDPIYTRNADGGTAGGGSASAGGSGGGIGGIVQSGLLGYLNNADWSTSGFMGNLFGAGGLFAGGLAEGGIMSPGDWYMTGEHGPELLQVGSTSKVNNARDTSAMFAGGGATVHNHAWQVDARGATDPAAINAAVERGIRHAVPHIVAATQVAHKDSARRMPNRHT